MKIIHPIFFITLLLALSCSEEIVNPGGEDNSEDSKATFLGSWKLVFLSNTSDVDKYLNSVLELKTDNDYSMYGNSGVKAFDGTFTISNKSITLNQGLFENRDTQIEIVKLNSDEFWTKEHYTLDNKDVYIEYHWTKQ